MSDLFLNKLAFCALSTSLLMTGLHESSRALFGHQNEAGLPPPPDIFSPPDPDTARDYHALFAVADAGTGQSVSATCTPCHRFEEGASALIGPALFGVLGRDIASAPGYTYSSGDGSLSALAGDWDYAGLDRFLENPKKFAPGTAMTFIGVKKIKDRIDLIAYLRTLTTDEPQPLP